MPDSPPFSMPRPGSPRARTRAAILDAASEAFRVLGFEACSMEEIARRAGMARATLYYHFAAKEEIAIGIGERYKAEGYRRLVAQQAAGADVLTLLDNFFGFAGAWIADNRDAARISTAAVLRGIGKAPDRPGTTSLFEQLVAQGQAEGLLRDDLPPAVIARLLTAILTQTGLLGPGGADAESGTTPAPEPEPTQWPRRLLHVALDGLRPRKGRPS